MIPTLCWHSVTKEISPVCWSQLVLYAILTIITISYLHRRFLQSTKMFFKHLILLYIILYLLFIYYLRCLSSCICLPCTSLWCTISVFAYHVLPYGVLTFYGVLFLSLLLRSLSKISSSFFLLNSARLTLPFFLRSSLVNTASISSSSVNLVE